MVDEKDLTSLDRLSIEVFREQLTIQESSVLCLSRSGQLSVSTQIAVEKERLDEIAKDLIEKIDAISSAEINLKKRKKATSTRSPDRSSCYW